MGRYYTGDIEGKFWFGIQSSTAGERFGAYETRNNIDYQADDLEEAEEEIKNIEYKLQDKIKILDDFFAKNDTFSNEKIKALGVSPEELSDYADLGLGRKIRDCIKEQGYCSFDAEIWGFQKIKY